jgi:quinol monooxygenase YgiN
MLVVMVDVKVKPGTEGAFVTATTENAKNSRQESGIAAFDVLVDPNDSTHFTLIEVYRDAQAPALHKQTAHYETWRSTVESMMREPRSSQKWQTVDAEY